MASERLGGDLPPTEPGPVPDYSEPPGWPKVVGIISIVWGVLGFTCAGYGAVKMVLGGGGPDMPQPGPVQFGLIGINVLLVGLLITAGALTAARKPLGRPMHLLWAMGAIVVAVGGTILQYPFVMQTMEAAAKEHPEQAKMMETIKTFAKVMMVVGVVIGMIWPVFCLIWFGLVKRGRNAMGGWGPEPAA